MGKKVGICQFCLEPKKLMRAHVISRALFRELFKIDKVHLVKTTNLEGRNPLQDAFYDTGILCVGCDNSFSPYEQYFIDMISGNAIKTGIISGGNLRCNSDYSLEILKGVNHMHLRMFFLITIWRCSISKQPSFDKVNLGQEMEDSIAREIKSGVLEGYQRIPTILISLHNVNDVRKEAATTPVVMRFGSYRVVVFMVRGWVLMYNLDSVSMPDLFSYCLNDTGDFSIVKLDQEAGAVFLDKLTGLNGDFRVV